MYFMYLSGPEQVIVHIEENALLLVQIIGFY